MADRQDPLPTSASARTEGSTGRRLVVMTGFALLAAVLGVTVVVVFRHDTATSDARCGPVIVETIDPQSSQHLLPTSREPDYRGDTPTSGPHEMGVTIEGVVDHPISKPLQVSVLQRGSVLVQYPPGTAADEVVRLGELGGPDVVVAPNPAIDEVVATAWGRRLVCPDDDMTTLGAFVAQYAGLGPRMGVAG